MKNSSKQGGVVPASTKVKIKGCSRQAIWELFLLS